MQARKPAKLMRQREDHVKIRYRQEFFLSRLEPCLNVCLVAFGTATVTTGVIRILLLTAVITFKNMASQGRRTASEYVRKCASVTGRHSLIKFVQILGAVASKDVGHFDHGSASVDQSRRMSSLILAWTPSILAWVKCM